MDFFDAQNKARRRSRWLLLWYVPMIAVFSLGLSVLVAIASLILYFALLSSSAGTALENIGVISWREFFGIGSVLSALYLLLASWWRRGQLRRTGGVGVARELGGELIGHDSSDAARMRALHVVEEISIASGMRMPKVFVLPKEQGINAFAAGYTPQDHVIGLTQGALENLSRDQLQAVVSHEFGHLQNGDTLLNMRLLSIFYGMTLLFRLGEKITDLVLPKQTPDRPRDDEVDGSIVLLLLFGVGLVLYSLYGIWLARMAQAAVSRQREFLADASAVQLTRNPRAVVAALDTIHGLSGAVRHDRAHEMAHFFFFDSASLLLSEATHWLDRLLATHPPVIERIARIDESFIIEAAFHEDAAPPVNIEAESLAISLFGHVEATPVGGAHAPTANLVQDARRLLHTLPEALLADCRNIDHAEYPLYATLIAREAASRQAQYRLLVSRLSKENSLRVIRHADWMRAQKDAFYRLPVFDLCLASLQRGSHQLRRDILQMSEDLLSARADQQQFFAHLLRLLLVKQLDADNAPPTAPLRFGLARLQAALAQLFALIAHEGSEDDSARKAAFEQAVRHLEPNARWPMPTLTAAPDGERLLALFDHLEISNPLYRRKILEACACAVRHDGVVQVREAELIRAIGQVLNAPVPLSVHYASVVEEDGAASSPAATPSTA